MSEMNIVRQGDVLLIQVDPAEIAADAPKVARKGGRIIIAEGETTGHAHAVRTRGVDMVEMFHDHYLVASKPFEVVHEEHGTAQMPAGTFKIVHQREKTPEAIRRVID